MGNPSLTLLFVYFTSIIIMFTHSEAMPTATATAKDQVACTMCSACDNPCQPVLSPPPPSPPPPQIPVTYCPPPLPPAPVVPQCPPPLPPAPVVPQCPPPLPPAPPLPPCPSTTCPPASPYSPPPPSESLNPPPAPGGGGGAGGGETPNGSYYPPPSGPMWPYPFPPPTSSGSITWKRGRTISSLLIIIVSLVGRLP